MGEHNHGSLFIPPPFFSTLISIHFSSSWKKLLRILKNKGKKFGEKTQVNSEKPRNAFKYSAFFLVPPPPSYHHRRLRPHYRDIHHHHHHYYHHHPHISGEAKLTESMMISIFNFSFFFFCFGLKRLFVFYSLFSLFFFGDQPEQMNAKILIINNERNRREHNKTNK